ncbi:MULTISPECIES: hypothetical protein [Nostocales]|nr:MULTISPECIES: hypothetical protein [Nostocales]
MIYLITCFLSLIFTPLLWSFSSLPIDLEYLVAIALKIVVI